MWVWTWCLGALLLAWTTPQPLAAAEPLERLAMLPLPDGGEVLDYATDTRTLAVTGEGVVRLFAFNADATFTPGPVVDLREGFGARDRLKSVSSVALAPAGRGYGVATLIPSDNGLRRGRVALFGTADGAVLRTLEAGFHPDALRFDPSSRWVVVVNEGEFTVGGDADAPGSVSLVDVSEVTRPDAAGLARFAGDFPLVWHAMAPGVTLEGLRFNDPTATRRYRHVEPEYVAFADRRAFVTLQENNAIGVFDLERRQWVALWPLGTTRQTIDASDRDGPDITDTVEGLPMPDTLAAFRVQGRDYLLTANEGDSRVDDGDRRRAGDWKTVTPGPGVDPEALGDPARLARLHLSTVDSDPDGDGTLDRVVAFGTRGVGVWDARTGEPVGETGSLEAFLLDRDPQRHNIDAKKPGTADARSPDKGPEPEALAVTTLPDGRVFGAVGMERQNGVVLLDLTDPARPTPVAYHSDLDAGLAAPESMRFIPAAESPTGGLLLLVGYEGADGAGCGVSVLGVSPPRRADDPPGDRGAAQAGTNAA